MKILKDGKSIYDKDWGAIYEIMNIDPQKNNISVCLVKINDLKKIAQSLTSRVIDRSWMLTIDRNIRRQYEYTVEETSELLIEIFKKAEVSGTINAEFGELMVSIGSSHALKKMFNYISLPIAELWKFQKKQNEGFDFHTVCEKFIINFGEAKYSGRNNPYFNAADQTDGFFEVDKQYRDRTFLRDFVDIRAIQNLDKENYGAIIAFSMNSENPEHILKNAIEKTECYKKLCEAQHIYIVGVVYDD